MITIICSCVNALRMPDPHCDECEGTGQIEYSDEELPIEYCEEEPL